MSLTDRGTRVPYRRAIYAMRVHLVVLGTMAAMFFAVNSTTSPASLAAGAAGGITDPMTLATYQLTYYLPMVLPYLVIPCAIVGVAAAKPPAWVARAALRVALACDFTLSAILLVLSLTAVVAGDTGAVMVVTLLAGMFLVDFAFDAWAIRAHDHVAEIEDEFMDDAAGRRGCGAGDEEPSGAAATDDGGAENPAADDGDGDGEAEAGEEAADSEGAHDGPDADPVANEPEGN